MKTLASILFAVLFLATASLSHAQLLLTQTATINQSVVSATTIPLSFSAFDPSLGTLTLVSYSITGTLDISGYITRTGAYNITFNLPYRLQGGSPLSQLDAQTISSNISGGSVSAGTTVPDNYNVSIQVSNLSKTATPSAITFQSGLLKTPTTGSYSIGSAVLDGTVTLTYEYTPAAAPEPTSWALMLAGLGMLLFWQIRRYRA
jgi:MYXO-CTERM domain-containing protein